MSPEEQRRYLGIINAQSRRLSSLLNDFLDAERMEEGELELSRQLIDLGSVVAEQVQLYRVKAPSIGWMPSFHLASCP